MVFFYTGTGEAPQNSMIIELLRKGLTGPIVSAVTVRKWADLGYMEQHRTLESRYQNYHYLPLPTREADVPKQYLQDLIRQDVFQERFGVAIDSERTNVFLGSPQATRKHPLRRVLVERLIRDTKRGEPWTLPVLDSPLVRFALPV